MISLDKAMVLNILQKLVFCGKTTKDFRCDRKVARDMQCNRGFNRCIGKSGPATRNSIRRIPLVPGL